MINVNPNIPNYPNTLPKKGAGSSVSIFYVNDFHGNIENLAGAIAASDKFDKEAKEKGADTLKISAGDNIAGGNDKKNQLGIHILERLGIGFTALGNHELDATLSALYKYINPDKMKVLAANAKVPEGSEFYNNVQKSTVIEVNGNKYGLVGLLPFDLETVTGNDDKKMEGIRPESVEKSIEIVNEETKKLTEAGVNKIILVSHIGYDKDVEIAPKLHGVDVIVGGHSHTEVKGVEPNKNLLTNADGKPIIIVQTGENGKNVGILNVDFDENGVPVKIENNLVKVSREKSPVLSYIQEAALGKSPKIGFLKEADPLPANRRTTPCAWTNLMCDALRSELDVDVAFINAANTRKVPKTGIITERDISESAPLKNTLLIKKMTEKEIVTAIKDSLSATFGNETGEPGMLHASGLSYVADKKGNLKELNFVDKLGNKTPIDINNPKDKVYSVCYDSFVAKGTEYPVFVPETMTYKEIDKTFDFDKDKVMIDYLRKSSAKDNLIVKDDGRLVILDENGVPSTVERQLAEENGENKKEVSTPPEISNHTVAGVSPMLMSMINAKAAVKGYSSVA